MQFSEKSENASLNLELKDIFSLKNSWSEKCYMQPFVHKCISERIMLKRSRNYMFPSIKNQGFGDNRATFCVVLVRKSTTLLKTCIAVHWARGIRGPSRLLTLLLLLLFSYHTFYSVFAVKTYIEGRTVVRWVWGHSLEGR